MNVHDTGVAELASQYVKLIGDNDECRLHLVFDQCHIEFITNSPELTELLREYYRPFLRGSGVPDAIQVIAIEGPPPDLPFHYQRKMPDPGKTRIKEEFVDLRDGRVVRKRLTGMVFMFGDGINLAVGPCRESSNQVINFINNRHIEFELRLGAVLAHAAGVSSSRKGLALAGFSSMGKSTLALHLLGSGLDYVSNDRLVISRWGDQSIMKGVAKQPRVNPGTIVNNPELEHLVPDERREELKAMSRDELWNLEEKYDVMVPRLFGIHRWKLRAPLDALAILNWTPDGGKTCVEQVDIARRPDLLRAFRKEPGLFYLAGQHQHRGISDDDYIRVLSDCAVYEVSGGVDFQVATEACREILSGSPASLDRRCP